MNNGRNGGSRRGEDGFIDPLAVVFSGKVYPRSPVMNLVLSLQPESWTHCEQILAAVGDGLGAYFGTVIPPDAASLLDDYASWQSGRAAHWLKEDGIASSRTYHEAVIARANELQDRLDASRLCLPDHSEMASLAYRQPEHPAQPRNLGWLNYWSKEACEQVGFPNPSRDADLLAHSYATPSGAWLLKLTEAPLDLGRPDHLAALAHAYGRFPRMGLCMAGRRAMERRKTTYPQTAAFLRGTTVEVVQRQLAAYFQGQELLVAKEGREADLTAIVFPGATGWVVVKTQPETFLAERKGKSNEPHIAALCGLLGVTGYFLHVRNEIEGVLMEVTKSGSFRTSGFLNTEGDQGTDGVLFDWLDSSAPVLESSRLPGAEDLLDVDDLGELIDKIYQYVCEENSDLCADVSGMAGSSRNQADRHLCQLRFRRKDQE